MYIECRSTIIGLPILCISPTIVQLVVGLFVNRISLCMTTEGVFNRAAIKIKKLDVASQKGPRMTYPVEFWQGFYNGFIHI